ncbi:MAG: hypothetical protein PVS2B1_21910 [Candidatus Dormibacteraceae bacterium]
MASITPIVIADLSGGRNGADSPLSPAFGPTQCVDAVNVDWYRTTFCRKRYGSSNLSMAGSPFVGTVSFLGRHVPSTDESLAELWACDDGTPSTLARLAGGVTWAGVTIINGPAVGSAVWEITGASFDGKYFLAFKSNVGRLHVWDPVTTSVRMTGIAPGGVGPTVADVGAGAYAATLRYYRVRWYSGAPVSRMSEATPSVSFTPSGAGVSARVIQPAPLPGEGELGWYVEGSSDNVTFYVAAILPIATTFWDDTNPVANYSAGTTLVISKATGRFTLQKAYRFIAADQNRLIGFGSWTAADKQNRVEFGAILGSLDQSDSERVDTQTNWYKDLDENSSDLPTGLIGPLFGSFFAFKSRSVYELSATGSTTEPYRATAISRVVGMVQGHAGCIGEDVHGSPCLYFMFHRGVYRYGASYQYGVSGLTYISRGIEDLILGPTSTMNMAATKVISHMVWHADLRQVWVWFATGSSTDPNVLCKLDVMTNGWSRFTGDLTSARCSTMFANTLGAAMGFQLKPYLGSTLTVNRVMKGDDTTQTTDAGNSYRAFITTKPIEPGGPGFNGRVSDLLLTAPVATGVTITATVTPVFGASPVKTGTASLTASGSESRVIVELEDTELAGSEYLQITIGDAATAANQWSLDRVVCTVGPQEPIIAP